MNIQNSAIDPDQSSSAPMAEPHDFDLRRIFVIFRRRFRLMLVVGAVVFLAAAVITMLMTPLYTATSRVMINTRKEDVVNTQAVMSGLTLDTSVTDTEVEVLRSRQLTERVSAAMNLDTDPEFNKTLKPPTPVSTSIAAVRSTLKKLLPPKPISAEQAAIQAHQKIIDNLLGNLSVKRSGTTYVIDIAFTSEMPGKAAKIANKYAELYMLQQLQTKFDAGKQATGWLNDRLTELRAQVQADDAALQNYRVNNNLMSTNAMGLTEQEITSDNLQVASARGQAAEDRARLEAAKAQRGRGEEVGEATNSEVIRNLRAQRSTLSAKVAELSGTFGPKHPALITAQRQLDDVDAAIKLEVGRVIAKLEAQSKASQDRLASLQASAGKAQGTLANSNRAMVRFNDLQRNADASKTLYESYLNRFKETSSVQGIEKADANVVSMAQTPTRPSSPKLMIGLALGVAMGGLCALAALILAENLDAGLSTSSDVERRLRFRYLAGIPSVDSVSKKKNVAPADYIVQNPLSSFAEAFRNLRAAVQHAPISSPVKVVAITSALPGEGKTVAAICLARSAAMQGAKVAVIDCDLRRHSLDRVMQIKAEIGLMEVLSGKATLDQALVRDEGGAMILPLSSAGFAGKDVFGSPAMADLLVQMRQRFDLVILDAAPVLPVVDTRVLAARADATIFLVRWRKTPQQAADQALKILTRGGANIAGVALTQINMRQQARYAYGDPAYYYDQYKSYYTSD